MKRQKKLESCRQMFYHNMTADVILGVRDKCEKSGIYHYISKPFDPERFIQTIKDIILGNKLEAELGTVVLDRQQGIKYMGGNKELYSRVLKEYRSENQDTLDRLDKAIREKRYEAAAQIAHKVKGISGSIGANLLQEAAASLQEALIEKP